MSVSRRTRWGALAVLVALCGAGRGDEPAVKTGDKPAAKQPAKPRAKPRRIVQLADGSVTLTGPDATIHGTRLRYEPEKDTLGYWTKVDDYVSWDLAITQPGRFAVELYQSSGQGDAGSQYTVEIGDEKLKGRVQDTAGFNFQHVRPRIVGAIELKEPGRYMLTVRPQSKPGVAVMDLRWVKLLPVRPKKGSSAAPEPGKSGAESPPGSRSNSAGPRPEPAAPNEPAAGK